MKNLCYNGVKETKGGLKLAKITVPMHIDGLRVLKTAIQDFLQKLQELSETKKQNMNVEQTEKSAYREGYMDALQTVLRIINSYDKESRE